ncbi:LRIF1 factor, partial [Rhinopomastus cyanomelas]|nr:LRIF1 factor [Rhinopomastus cyanomelas]
SIAGSVYQVVQTTGPDGKNLLTLIPVSKSAGSFVPIVQSSAMSSNSNVNISSPLHTTFKTQLTIVAAPSSLSPGKIFLARTLENQDSVRTDSENKSLAPKSAANSQSTCACIDRLLLQNIAVTSNPVYTIINTRPLPDKGKSPPVLLGNYIQIPADAEVKYVPVSFLPPVVQEKILAPTPTSVSEGAESAKTSNVIYVSPVKAVKTAPPKQLVPGHQKPATEVPKRVVVISTQKGDGSSKTATSNSQQCQQAPVQQIVQETPRIPTPSLISVKSSNNVASKILQTLSDNNSTESGPTALPACSVGADGSQEKIAPIQGNALVMCNGKVYLLTRKGFDVQSAQADKPAPSTSDASLKKDAVPELKNSSEINKITTHVVKLVLSKTKGVVVYQAESHPCTISINPSSVGLGNGLEPAPAALATPNANQQSPAVDQKPFIESSSSGVTPVTAVGLQQSVCQVGREASHSPTTASAVFPQSEPECKSSEDLQKIQCEKMDSPAKVIKIEHQEKPSVKQYMELRKKFGLFQEERVYLKRIPSCTRSVEPEKRSFATDSLRKKNCSCSSSPFDVEITDEHQERAKGEKVIANLGEYLTNKRKRKSSPVTESGKRREKSNTNLRSENTISTCSVLEQSVSPPPLWPEPSISSDLAVPPVEEDSVQDPSVQCNDNQDPALPVPVSCESSASILEESPKEDASTPELDETVRDEKIKRLKQLLREREAALEEIRRK